MKQQLLRLGKKIDALTLRERAMVFAAALASMLFIAHHTLLDPLFSQQAALRSRISLQQDNLAGIDAEITRKVQSYAFDPDAAGRARLAVTKAEIDQLGSRLRAMQKGLVAPERIAPLLETILKGNGHLRLVSMTTLPVSSLSDGTFNAPSKVPEPPRQEAAAAKPADLLYRHGVQLAVRGNYLDMVNYMSALEAMPTQLFWGKAQLNVEEYPNAQLTLTLYTLSLDRKWMKL
jgi:MSHA biogenesis protein MshJ